MNEYERFIVDSIYRMGETKRVTVEPDASNLFLLLTKHFPPLGSKIDWRQIPESITEIDPDREQDSDFFLKRFQSIVSQFHLTGPVAYIGDSLTDFALISDLATMSVVLPIVMEVPHHHYLIHPSGTWCMSFSMEGEFGFGFSRAPIAL